MTVIAMFYKALLLQPVHGHRSSEAPSPFRQTRDGEIHFTEDPEINFASIAFNSYIPKTVGQTSVKGILFRFEVHSWLSLLLSRICSVLVLF